MADGINDLILRMHERLRVTSITVTHDLRSAYKIANRIAMLHEGKIIHAGTPDEIKKDRNPIIQQFISGSSQGPLTD
jgi:phospholipid/cholesterol/gamma-HCH transport system ATP-binding protein